MNTKVINDLTKWLQTVVENAKCDEQLLFTKFENTKNEELNIVAGWSKGFSKDFADLLYISEADPDYAMCVKIVENNGPYAYTDFDLLDMPIDRYGEVEDTCIAIEQTDDLESLAQFLYCEWERLTDEYEA